MPGKSACVLVDDLELGYLAQVMPRHNLVSEVGQNAYALELDLGVLENSLPPSSRFQPIEKFPEAYRDISILVDRFVTSEKIESLILKTGSPLIQKVALYDHFEGKKIQDDKKSLTFALSFQSADRTLSDEEVAPLFEKIIQTLKSELGASLRE
jgi:phenylalanyl-tRNA synthetase beta chain